ncbi:uncharacterized protein [Primulina eburnea]|uniref:uncharacterized protein n=1 Tax=Primulina eburnea TaxID=1245227 RepID=UPI003C6C1E21
MSQQPGKNLQNQDSIISLEDHKPGCMKGIFHHFNNHKWHHVKKRLPHKRHGTGKNAAVIGDPESSRSAADGDEIQEKIEAANSAAETKAIDRGPGHKSSMKSRIKALIAEEMSKRKGRHRRSSSYPVRTQLERTTSIHRLQLSNLRPLPSDNSKQMEANKRTNFTSRQESKLFLDALDLLDLRKEVFLKILQDPSCSLAQQLHNKRASNSKFGLTKSLSFPANGSSDRRALKRDRSFTKQENASCLKEEDELLDCIQVTEDLCKNLVTSKGMITENGVPHQFSMELDLSDNASPTSSGLTKKRHDSSKVSLKRFKNLREKIKHVILDRKKEKHRIIMDATLHKIPYGLRVSKDQNDSSNMHQSVKAKKSGKGRSRSGCQSDQLGLISGMIPSEHFKRTSSFNESLVRYNRLLEISCNREAKEHVSESLRLRPTNSVSPVPSRPATLGRILSLPDLRFYSSFQIEDSPSTSPLNTSSMESNKIRERRPSSIGSDDKFQIFTVSESGSQENFSSVSETFEDAFDSKTGESSSYNDFNLEPVLNSAAQPVRQSLVADYDFNYQEDKIDPIANVISISEDSELTQNCLFQIEEDTVETNITLGNQAKLPHKESLLDAKIVTEFNYVKQVLELSGFSGNQILGKLHSEENPMDPLVFDEVEGKTTNEGVTFDHLLLFDLINEVLLHIYEKSFCYWSNPLTFQSRMHTTPFGHHVLDEVWTEISCFLNWKLEFEQTIDDVVSMDFAKDDGWMNLQFDAECVGIEVEDLIFDDLLEEIMDFSQGQVFPP